MAQINLLPWREERRAERKKEFLMLLAAVVAVGIGLVMLGDRLVNGQIDYQKARNQYLTQEIRVLDKQVEEIKDLQRRRNQLIERMRVIQELQGNRPIIVRVLDQLVRTSQNNLISLTGIAESNNRVSSLMRRLDGSDWLQQPNLDSVRAATQYGDQAATFNLKVKVQLPASDNGAGE